MNPLLLIPLIVCVVDGSVDESDVVSRRNKRSFYTPIRERSARVTATLDYLLFQTGYDRQIRPQFGGPPLQIEVNFAVRSMGPVDERKQTFTMDCYFRQFWTDPRLTFNSSKFEELPMNWEFLTMIWRPDTVIINGIDSYLHKMTVPNRFIRIYPDGKIAYSQRLTVKAKCKMDLRKFPLDSQFCPLEIGSFGHNRDDILYYWSKKPLSMDKKLGLAQYHLVQWNHTEDTRPKFHSGNASIISLSFTFQRRTGFYLLQIYIPLTLIVCCSWITFWLIRTPKGGEVPARTSLGAMTVLGVVTIGFSGKSKPQVGYATALDVFIVMCFFIVFAALMEFACLNFIDTLIRRLKSSRRVARYRWNKIRLAVISNDDQRDRGLTLSNWVQRLLAEERRRTNKCSIFDCRTEIYGETHKFLRKIDARSRKFFPLTFLLLNIIYWASYVYIF